MNHFTQRFSTGKALAVIALLLCGTSLFAQVTTSTISGIVSDKSGEPLIGATVVATHTPTNTRYGTATNASGRYTLPAVRVGGPYSVTVSYTGYESQTLDGIYASLGTAANVDFQVQEAGSVLEEVTITANRNDIFSSDRTGAATTFDRQQLATIPITGARSINSITKYNPNGNGNSFGGQDSRMNNFTIDGSVFNNGFGLGTDAQAGGRTGSTAISLDAIEELQVNVAPFDVRQTGFVGTGMNAVTRSGKNEFFGSAFFNFRKSNDSGIFNGTKIGDTKPNIGAFDEQIFGASFGGALIKNKLFFFANYESQRQTTPATTWVADGSPLDDGGSNVTRVLASDLDALSSYLLDKYRYETGPYENYDNKTESDKFLVRLDWNVNDKNKLTLRYTHHNSLSDQLISNSNSAGAGNRRTLVTAMSYQNAGYIIGDNTRSFVAELNSQLSNNVHNTFSAGYDFQDEDRQYKGSIFPTIDILKNNSTYISVGFDPFTPNNKLSYGTLHFTDNVSIYKNKHTYTFGVNFEQYKSDNLFFPASNGVYVFDSLAQFYAASEYGLMNPDSTNSAVQYNRFQYRYSALPGAVEPLQSLKVNKYDLYAQDEFQISNRFKLTYGIRAGIISFDDTGLSNATVDGQDYVDENGNRGYKIQTGKLPDPKVLWEPRTGFNWDVFGNKKTQVRGGLGIFTGRPPYVWVSNTIGNNGVLTGYIDDSGTKTLLHKFTPETNIFIPETPTLPTTFDIAATANAYRFPQVWKNNLALDQKLPLGLIATVELMYNRNVNAVRYFDANFEEPTGTFSGPDNRPRFAGNDNGVRINDNVSRAAVMTTTNEGWYQAATLKLEYPNKKGFYGMAAHTFSQAKDLMSAGSIAGGSWTSARSVRGNNDLDLAFADQDAPGRTVGLLGYRFEYGGDFGGATAITVGYVGERRGFTGNINAARFSYSYAGDMNGDRVFNNDLLFVPNNASELNFRDLTVNYKDAAGASQTKTFTGAEQATAFEAFIKQDDYLSGRRGQYAERNGVLFPILHRFDVSVTQEFYLKIGGKRNTIQFRADILNAANLLNSEWGLGNNFVSDRPLSAAGTTADGVPQFRMATQTINNEPVLIRESFVKSKTQFDVWVAQFGIRYIFN
ncbi:MAG: carboxypeptidase regulatory-like domain-containing protein [Saprospiraceae bacterium]|nr:carboxypeptidase regulatory-like domain-containing protein [Saprospiraceae bacterium]